MKQHNISIKFEKKAKKWDGITNRDIIKYMRELEEEKGFEYARNHYYIVNLREKKDENREG